MLSLVVGLATTADPEKHLHSSPLEVDLQRNERQTLFESMPGELGDLPPVQE